MPKEKFYIAHCDLSAKERDVLKEIRDEEQCLTTLLSSTVRNHFNEGNRFEDWLVFVGTTKRAIRQLDPEKRYYRLDVNLG